MIHTADDERWLRRALDEARAAAEHGDVPVGAVVVASGEVVAAAHNRREADRDPTAHAELLALRAAAARMETWRLEGATVYTTLEPCPMCAGALVNARVRRLVYGCDDPKAGAARTLFSLCDDGRLNHRMEVVRGCLAEEAATVLRDFFARLR